MPLERAWGYFRDANTCVLIQNRDSTPSEYGLLCINTQGSSFLGSAGLNACNPFRIARGWHTAVETAARSIQFGQFHAPRPSQNVQTPVSRRVGTGSATFTGMWLNPKSRGSRLRIWQAWGCKSRHAHRSERSLLRVGRVSMIAVDNARGLPVGFTELHD